MIRGVYLLPFINEVSDKHLKASKDHDRREANIRSICLSWEHMSVSHGRSCVQVPSPSTTLHKAYLRHIVAKHNFEHRFKIIDSYDTNPW
jgi:hypothetical protein